MPSPRIAQKVGLLPSPAFIPGRRERERTPPNPASGATYSTAIGHAQQPTQAGPSSEGFRLVSGHKGIRGIDHPATTGEFAPRERKGTGSNMAGGPDRSASPPVTQAGAVTRYNGSRPENASQLQTHAQAQTPAEAYALAYGGTSRRASRVGGPAYLVPTSGVTRATVTSATPDAVATITTTTTATPTPTPATGRDSMWMTMDQHVREHSSKGRKRVAEKAKERELGPDRGRERDKEKDKDRDSHTHGGVLVSKPIFEWITRKLGAGRRATITGASDSGGGSQADPANIGGPSRLPPRYQDMTATANVTQRARRIDAGGAIDEMGMTREDSEQPAVAISPTSVPVPIRQTRSTRYHDAPAPYRSTISPATPPRTRIGPTPHPARPQLSPTQIFPPVRDRMSVVSRSETLSLRSYRLASPSERERRREANNPYPSIPMPLLHRGSIMTTTTDAPSMSFLSRSISRDGSLTTSVRSIRSGRSGRSAISARSYSGRSGRSIRTGSIRSVEVRRRSIASSLRPRLSILERRRREGGPLGYGNSYRDGSFYAHRDSLSRSRSRGLSQTLGGPSIHTPSVVDHPLSHRSDPMETTPVIETDPANGCYTPALADEDASIRPFPPSHPNSPTPSPSIISRTSRSASDALGSRPTPSQSQAGMSGVHMVEEAGSIEATPHYAASSNGRLPDGPGVPDVLSASAAATETSPQSGSPRRVVIARSPSGSSAPTSVSGRSRQGSCSTRPTTVRSFDSGSGVAHIAQAPGIAFAPVPDSPLDPTVSAETGLADEIHSPSAAQALGVPTATALPTYFNPAAPQHAHHGHTAIAVSSPLRETVSSGSSGTTSPVSPVSGAHDSPSSIAAIPPTSPANIDESAAPTPLAALSPARSALDIENDTITSPIGSAGHEPQAPPPVNTNTSAPPPVPHTAASQRYSVQAPRHTPHHPFFNPHPSATPAANASTLTLASSTFAQGPARPTSVSRLSLLSNGPSVHGSLVPHRASLPGQSITWAEERDEDANSAGDAVADGDAAGGAGATGRGSDARRSSEPLSRSPRLGEIRDTEEGATADQSHLPRRPAPQLAAPLAPLAPTADTLHSPLQAHTLFGHRPPSIAPSTYSFHSSEPYHYNNSAHGYNYNYNRPGSVFGAATGTSFKTTHTGWTGASASASASAWALRFGPGGGAGADEEASMRAIRRRGSAGSMESFESRWSWAPARGVVVQGRGDGVSA